MKTNYDKVTEFENIVDKLFHEDEEYGTMCCKESPNRVDGECPYSDSDRLNHCKDCIRAWLKEEVKPESFGEVSNNIAYYLEKRNYNQREFARVTGITEVTLSRYIKGDRNPNVETAMAMARVLGCSVEDLFKFDRKENA